MGQAAFNGQGQGQNGGEMNKDETTAEEKQLARLEEEVKTLRRRLFELESSVRRHMTYHSHSGGQAQ